MISQRPVRTRSAIDRSEQGGYGMVTGWYVGLQVGDLTGWLRSNYTVVTGWLQGGYGMVMGW